MTRIRARFDEQYIGAGTDAMNVARDEEPEDTCPEGAVTRTRTTTYRIVRLFQGDYPRKRGSGGLTLAEAQAHCCDPETSSSTCTNAEGKRLTEQRGPWFDAYYEEE